MDLKRLKYFCTVVEQRSITRAAQMLHMSQPPLSKRLQELEEECGCSLLTRYHDHVEPTADGAFLYQRAVTILRDVTLLETDMAEHIGQERPVIRIGLGYLYKQFFRDLILRLQELTAQQIVVFSGDTPMLEQKLRANEIDVALIQRPVIRSEYDCIDFDGVNTVVVANRNIVSHISDNALQLAELAQLPLLMLRRSQGGGTFELLLDKIRKLGVVPNVMMCASEPRLLVDWLENGVEAAALLPESEVNIERLPHCRMFHILPTQPAFFPAIVKLNTKPWIGGIDELVAQGYPF